MVALTGIGGILKPVLANSAEGRERRKTVSDATATQDGVTVSEEARKAVEIHQLLERAGAESEIRAERVKQAKESIEQGTYQLQEAVLQVASRVAAYV